MKPFAHLHLHTEYSLLDGAIRCRDIFKRCDELGMPAVAITDHGNMYGIMDFMHEAVKYTDKEADFIDFFKGEAKLKVKPILGCEIYMCDDLTVKESVNKKAPRLNHFILLAKNEVGYKNLVKIVSKGWIDGYYYKPRVDFKTLCDHSEGLVALSACVAGVIPQSILHNDIAGAERWICKYKELFGSDFYIEIQNHNIADERAVLPHLVSLAKKNGVKTVGTNDAHYLTKDDARMQRVLMSIAFKTTLRENDTMREGEVSTDEISEDRYFPTNEFYVKTYDEMLKALPGMEEALDNTLEIAAKCDYRFFRKEKLLPNYLAPNGMSSADYLRKLTYDGLQKKYGIITDEIRERAEYELGIIIKLNFVEYFLIVWDFIHHSESVGIPVGPGRGSGAGSIIAYAIGITKIDPIKHALIFERFLNPERVSNPDFDIDFCVDRRGEVVDYVIGKYGKDNVSQIATFGTMASKAAIKDVGRVFNMPYSDVDRITKLIPRGAEKLSINDMLGLGKKPETAVAELKDKYVNDPNAHAVLEMAAKIEGMPRQTGMHAAGVIICRDPIADHVPLARSPEGLIVTQFDMINDEALGLLKMDFLGLTTLTDIKKAIDYVYETRGVKVDFYDNKFEYNDQEVFKLIADGDTVGVFQLESPGMIRFMRELKPTSLEDVIAGIALYRPGPMDAIPMYIANKNNPDKIVYKHPLLKPILDVTYGVTIYQEQVMEIVRNVAGFSMGRADNVRRFMSKKKMDKMEHERAVFINGDNGNPKGAVANGVPADVASSIYDDLIAFANYGFNKSHAAAYGYLSYQAAYLKRYYKEEFFAALLNNRINKLDELTKYLTYLKECHVSVLQPDINKSKAQFSVETDGKTQNIRIGMSAIRGVGLPIIESIVEERTKNGEYSNLEDFLGRMADAGVNVNKRLLENLIYAGTFDCFSRTRSQLIAVYGSILDRVAGEHKATASGQLSLFQFVDEVEEYEYPIMDEYPEDYKLMKEKEVAGVYLSGHPLTAYVDRLKQYKNNIGDLAADNPNCLPEGTRVTLGGIMSDCQNKMTKSGTELGIAKLEDMYGTIEILSSGANFSKLRDKWNNEQLVTAVGKITYRDEKASMWVDTLTPWVLQENGTVAKYKAICCYFKFADEANLAKLKEIAGAYNGNDVLYFKNLNDNKTYLVNKKFDLNECSLLELSAVIGKENISVKEQ